MESLLKISFEDCKPARKDIFPVSVHCHSACNLVVWRANSDPGEEEMGQLKKYVARLMDRLADLMHDYQKFAPLVALIDMQENSASWLQLMGDQDWHRGRFVLQAVRSFEKKSVEDAKKRWLGALSSTEYTPRRITAEDFSSALSEAVKNAKPPRDVEPQLFTRFADILKVSVDAGESEFVAQSWQDELVKDINDLLGKPVLEVTSLE
jgi:site-specific recombinase